MAVVPADKCGASASIHQRRHSRRGAHLSPRLAQRHGMTFRRARAIITISMLAARASIRRRRQCRQHRDDASAYRAACRAARLPAAILIRHGIETGLVTKLVARSILLPDSVVCTQATMRSAHNFAIEFIFHSRRGANARLSAGQHIRLRARHEAFGTRR